MTDQYILSPNFISRVVKACHLWRSSCDRLPFRGTWFHMCSPFEHPAHATPRASQPSHDRLPRWFTLVLPPSEWRVHHRLALVVVPDPPGQTAFRRPSAWSIVVQVFLHGVPPHHWRSDWCCWWGHGSNRHRGHRRSRLQGRRRRWPMG